MLIGLNPWNASTPRKMNGYLLGNVLFGNSFDLKLIFVYLCYSAMNQERSGAGVVAVGQYIYVAGGMGLSGQLSSFERYDTEKDIWTQLSPMLTARSALTLAVLDKQIYAMGG